MDPRPAWKSKTPENQDYGTREGRRLDPGGNVIRFGGPPR
jgi:hypothetical protein